MLLTVEAPAARALEPIQRLALAVFAQAVQDRGDYQPDHQRRITADLFLLSPAERWRDQRLFWLAVLFPATPAEHSEETLHAQLKRQQPAIVDEVRQSRRWPR